jgi:hypothetical protein
MLTSFKSTVFQVTELVNASLYSTLVDYNFSKVTKNSTSGGGKQMFLKIRSYH